MEQNFQTSFIPKKPMVQGGAHPPSRPIGLLTVVSIFIFLTMLLAWGGLYFYEGFLAKNITQKGQDLKRAEQRFSIEQITQMQLLDKRLRASNEILSQHVAVSPIFRALSEITLKTVRFTSFTYDLGNTKDARVTVKLKGVAVGYRDVASQSDIFNEYKNKNFIDPVFSNLVRDDKGNVTFELTFFVDKNLIDYGEMLKTQSVRGTGGDTIIKPIESIDENKIN